MAKQARIAKQAPAVRYGDRKIPVNRLHLNLENFRHEPVHSEKEAIAKLCDSELIAELADDITGQGMLSPLEVLGVIPMEGHPGHFIVVEGNRRTCALILMADPARAPRDLRARITRIAERGGFPTEVNAHVFKDVVGAKAWIDRRHLGLQGGVGTKEWTVEQKQRAAGQDSRSSARDNTLAVSVLDRLEKVAQILEPSQRRSVNVSTLTRYLGTPSVRTILGLGHHRDLIYTHEPEQVDRALLRLVLDSIQADASGSCPVHSRSNSTQRLAYANALKREGIAPTDQLRQPSTPPVTPSPKASVGAPSSTPARNSVHPDRRKTIFPSDFVVAPRDAVLRRLHNEGRSLNPIDFPFSANYILRAFVEQLMIMFARAADRRIENLTDSKLQTLCADLLENRGSVRKAFIIPRKAGSDPSTPYSLHSLGNAVHGGSVPGATDLIRYFDTWRPALEAMLELLPKT